MKKYIDGEESLFQKIQSVPSEEILLLTNSDSERKLSEIIKKETLWINNSEDTNNPPDLYCDKYKLMGDLMKVDDSGHWVTKKKGKKYVNKEKEAIGRALKEFVKKMEDIAKMKDILILGDTSDVSTNEHHRYEWYAEEFKRIVGNHIDNIPLYKRKFPNYKTIFFIFDESTQYIQLDTCLYSKEAKECLSNKHIEHHQPYLDKRFLEIIEKNRLSENKIDYIVWYMPYKYVTTNIGIKKVLPTLVILDINNIDDVEIKEYYSTRIMSAEK